MISSRSVWAQSSYPIRIVVGIVGIVVFVLLFLVEHLYGNTSGLLNSVIWTFIPSIMSAVSILFLSVGFKIIRQERVVWYRQMTFFQGIGFLCMVVATFIFSFLFTVGANDNPAPSWLTYLLDSVFLFNAFLYIIQSIMRVPGQIWHKGLRTHEH